MPKLRYKDSGEKKKKKKEKKEKKSSRRSRSPSHRAHYKPPVYYENEEGWIPPIDSQKEQDDWNERLFQAMGEDEGSQAFFSQYEDYSSSTKPRNEPSSVNEMTDEEYRRYIEKGMWTKQNAEAIALEEKRKEEKEKRRKKREEEKARQDAAEAEARRVAAVYDQLRKLQKNAESRGTYEEKWATLDKAETITQKSMVWPCRGIIPTLQNIREFLINPQDSTKENRLRLRREQLRYHPDKILQRVLPKFKGTTEEQEKLKMRVNEVSGWLNELWTEMNHK
ncbi:hypothetical protein J3Q64DRAFT_1239243 [Phycomyces blakesleeanus]|uniref:J domain-containing protein n=1 Tax=Phycomyces blakesleeanus TaxID=4837 RepID=A0ABR3BCH1_PHYBL